MSCSQIHFTTAYINREQSETGTMGTNEYHTTANAINNDDALTNIELTISPDLSKLQLANNANPLIALASIAKLCTAIAASQQQIAMLTVASVAPLAPYILPSPSPALTTHHPDNNNLD